MLRLPPARAGIVGALASIAALALVLPTASGQSPAFSLEWDAPPGCPDQGYVRGEVDRLVEGGGAVPIHVDARAQVQRAADDRWRVHLVTLRNGATGERDLESTSCRSLADATALIVALTVDPERVAAHQAPQPVAPPPPADAGPPETAAPAATAAPPQPAPPRPPPAPSTSTSPAPPRPPPAPSSSPPVPLPPGRVAILPTLAGDVGTLPRPSYGVSLAAAVLLGRLRLEGFGTYWPPESAYLSASTPAGPRGDVQLATGGARACIVALPGRLELAACPGLEIGNLHGQGVGVRAALPADGLWVAATAAGRVTWRLLPNLGLTLDVGLAVPFLRDQIILDATTIHQAAVAAGRAAIGPELRF